MRLLVLGGTSFVGRHVVEAALEAGHTLTLFNRGRTNPDLFPDADRRTGDRTAGDYSSLADGEWDAVVDVNAYVPRHVAEATDAVDGRATRYLFVSTGSVYDHETGGVGEDAPRVAPIVDTETVDNETYGGLKVACEDVAADRWSDALTIVRPGIVAGPHDPTDRFTWWVRRCAAGDEVAAPARRDQPVQVIDGRDLAAFCLVLLDRDGPGAFDAVGPADPTTLEGLWNACVAAAGDRASTVTPIDPSWAAEHDAVFPPLVLPPSYDVLFRRESTQARAVGLAPRPLVDTARDTLAWDRARGEPPFRDGPDAAAEARLLASWHAR